MVSIKTLLGEPKLRPRHRRAQICIKPEPRAPAARTWGLMVTVACVSLLGSAANGDKPRLRTLTFDADRREWVETHIPPAGTAAGDLRLIKMQVAKQNFRQASSAIRKFHKKYNQDDPTHPESLIVQAEALMGQCEYDEAYRILQEFQNNYAGLAIESEAVRLQFVIAEAYLSGAKRRIVGLRLLSGVDLAYRILDNISANYPKSRYTELAIKTKGDHLFSEGEYALAEMEYDRLVRDYPQSRYLQYAQRQTADAALSSFAGVHYDDSALIEAQERYRDYQIQYSRSADSQDIALILDSIQESRARKELSIAGYYERTNHLRSAVFYYQSVRAQWPETQAAAEAVSRLRLLTGANAADGTDVQ